MRLANKDIRRTIVEIIHDSGAAHIGSALSMVEILNMIFKNVDLTKIKKFSDERDRVILSKGHGTAGLYATMFHHGLLSERDLRTYFKNGSVLAGHASHHVPHVEHSTGGLGHGLPVSVGIAIGMRARNINSNVFVVLGDGEMHEGSNWEAIMLAGHLKLNNLIIFIDQNEWSQVGQLTSCCSLEPLKLKLESFNFKVFDVDGHNENAINEAIQNAKKSTMPSAIICHTIKGKGISFMENNNLWHYKCPQGDDYEKALTELKEC